MANFAKLGREMLGNFLKKLVPPTGKAPGRLILIRHGETDFNKKKIFTGWVDADLNAQGIMEVEHAARLLLERGYSVDTIYTSRLKRAIKSTWIILHELNQIYRPVIKTWRLNERMYGALEGASKMSAVAEIGEDAVQKIRVGLECRPPEMLRTHPYWHGHEKKYADLNPKDIPVSESLHDTIQRTLPLLESSIFPELRAGQTVLIVAHANSLRGIVQYIEKLTAEEIAQVSIPNAIPLVYKFDNNMKVIKHTSAMAPLSGEYLEKKGALQKAIAREAELKSISGFITPKLPLSQQNVDRRILSLSRLNFDRTLYDDAAASLPTSNPYYDEVVHPTTPAAAPVTITPDQQQNPMRRPIVVIIRHGKTEYNKLGIFTGWDDAPLADEGKAEAISAGKILKLHGVEFDAVYTSWLSRAIETALTVLGELDSLWLTINKSWRLNERMYGSLTKLSKKMIAETYGQDIFRKWRRGYDVQPPPVSSFSQNYPGNDDRYIKYVTDMEVSVFESIIRSLSHRRLEIHRKFPKTESLKDCMNRTIPYYTNVIVPESIEKNKNVLIASSENAIRGLLMHLCDIPIHRIHEVEIPTGLPLVYDIQRRCIQLLESPNEEENTDPFVKYKFGTAPELLFKPKDLRNNDSANSIKNSDPQNGGTISKSQLGYDPYVRMVRGPLYAKNAKTS